MSRSFIDCKLFSILTSASCGPSAIAELLVSLTLASLHGIDCGLVTYIGDAALCNATEEYYCGMEAREDYIAGEDSECNCPTQCFTRSYDVTSSQGIYSHYFLDFLT